MSTAAVPNRQKNNNRDKSRSHISNRAGYGNINSHRKDGPDNEMSSSTSGTPVTGVFKDNRTASMLCSILGARTGVKTRNGKKYEGYTKGFSPEGDIALEDAKLEHEETVQEQNIPRIVIPRENFVVCRAAGVNFKALITGSSEFTDSAISSRLNGNTELSMKTLQPWEDDSVETATALMLDENQKGWEPSEMFQVNSEKFNVKSSYNEDLDGYTTPKVAPSTEGYEERERFAAKQAEEIEKSDVYKARIAKELSETSEEAKYASVNEAAPNPRSYESHTSGTKAAYTIPALRDNEQNMRNNSSTNRGQGRSQRQNSPYSSSINHSGAHPSVHNSRHHINNHFHQGPPPTGRNQVPPHPRQQQQSPSPSHGPHINPHHMPSHSVQQSLPMSQSSMQQQSSQQQRSSVHQQMASSTTKVHPNMPTPVQMQTISKGGHLQPSSVSSSKGAGALNNQQQISVPTPRPPVTQHVNGDTKPSQMEVNALSQKTNKVDVPAPSRTEIPPHKGNAPSSSTQSSTVPPRATETVAVSTVSVADSTAQSSTVSATAVVSTSQPISHDRRSGRGIENNHGETRTKVSKQLQDFSKNFVLENSTPEPSRTETEAAEENSTSSSNMLSSSGLPVSSISSAITESSPPSEQSSAASSKATEKSEDSSSSSSSSGGIISKLNPLAKEFTPAPKTPVAADAQSPSPQQRVSPQVMPQVVAYAPSAMYGYMHSVGIPTAASLPGVVSLQAQNKRVGRMSDLAAHQAHHVTGQPLLATSPQMVYMQPNQSGGFQVVNVSNPGSRMVTPNSFSMPQAGQPGPIDPANPQAQPQPVFLTGQQQPMPTPMPAHLTQHPQPAHAQALPNPSTNPTAQPAHVPNPAPSPVQHQPQQQTAQQYGGQPLPPHISQGPPQSGNPQATPYPPMSLHHGLPAMSRTSMAGQHGLAQSAHPSVSISYPLSTPHSYPNASPAQYSLTPAAQPQTSQNSNPGTGHQPHYVVMPHPPPHQPLQQQHHGQAYTTAGIQFQSGHNIVQGPSQMPPSHTPNPTQGGPHLIHPGMQAMPAGIHQQVPGTPSGMFMQVPSTLQQFQHQQ